MGTLLYPNHSVFDSGSINGPGLVKSSSSKKGIVAMEIDVRVFGADPTGVKDSTAAIQSAIDSVSPGAQLIFPSGTYTTTEPLNASKSQVTYKGFGQRSIIRNEGTGDAIQINGTTQAMYHRISFEGLRIEGNASSRFGLNARFVSTRLIFRDCEFSSHGDAGAFIEHCWSPVIYSSNFSGNCRNAAVTKRAGLYMDYTNNFVMSGTHCTNNNNGSDGLRINNAWAGTIDGCQLEDNARYGGHIQSAKGIALNGNFVEFNMGTFGLLVTGTPDAPCQGIVINGGIYNGADVSDYGIVISHAGGTVLNSPWCIRNNIASVRVAATASDTIINNITTDSFDADPVLLSNDGQYTQYNQGSRREHEGA